MARAARRAREFPALYPRALRSKGLDRRDAGLAWAIDQAVARRWLTLEAVLRSQLARPWASLHPAVQAALLVGAAQLLLMERVPDHAAVSESVAWVGAKVPAASSLVNAVLRRVAGLRRGNAPEPPGAPPRGFDWGRDELPWHDGRVLRLREPVFSIDPLDRLGEQTSHPRALLESWQGRLGHSQAAELAAHDLVHPPIVVTGADAPGCTPHEEPGYFVFPGDRSELEALLARCPVLWAQDPASAQAVSATADLSPRLIVEVCAGKGTQTRQLAALHPEAEIVASDASLARLQTLRQVFGNHQRVRVAEPRELIEFAGKADLVVVDAPCTNTAVLARRVEARYRFGPESLEQLAGLQRQILADTLRLPAAAGCLLYSTCSLEPQENEGQRDWLARWHGLRLLREGHCLPRGWPGDPPGRYRDGAYHALLQRQ